jgi:hypothetical protein
MDAVSARQLLEKHSSRFINYKNKEYEKELHPADSAVGEQRTLIRMTKYKSKLEHVGWRVPAHVRLTMLH